MSKFSKSLLYLVYYILVIGLGTVIVLAFTQNHSSNVTIHPSIKSQQVAQSKSQTHEQSNTASQPHNTSKQNSSKTTQKPAPTPAAVIASTGSTLENTGPGNYLSLFFVVSAIGAILFRQYMIYKMHNDRPS